MKYARARNLKLDLTIALYGPISLVDISFTDCRLDLRIASLLSPLQDRGCFAVARVVTVSEKATLRQRVVRKGSGAVRLFRDTDVSHFPERLHCTDRGLRGSPCRWRSGWCVAAHASRRRAVNSWCRRSSCYVCGTCCQPYPGMPVLFITCLRYVLLFLKKNNMSVRQEA